MKAHLRSFAVILAACCLALPAAAQTLRAASNNGVLVAPGTNAPRVSLIVRDNGGNPRAGVVVTFDAACVDRLRGELPPYACVTTTDPVTVATDANGIALSPQYVADLQPGNAWLYARAEVDGVLVSLPFYFRVGSSAPSPLQILQGDNQRVQIGFPIEQPMRARVVDDRGRAIVGVPVTFNSPCAPSVPCLLPPTGATQLVSDNQGFVDSGIRVANGVPGNHTVTLAFVGGGASYPFQFTNVGAVKTQAITTPLGDQVLLEMTAAPATCSLALMEGLSKAEVGTPPGLIAAPRSPLRVVIENCPAGSEARFMLQHPGGLPEGAGVWAVRPTWRLLETANTIEGFWAFSLEDGGAGDADGTANGRIEAVLQVAFGDPTEPNFQDLWWAGQRESGWGFSIVQHGRALFIVLFAYDAAGQPTWYVMPGGSWNEAGTVYTGNIYQPRGRPLAQHTASNLVVGAPAGSVSLQFHDVVSARMVLRIGNVESVKEVTRQLFGPREARTVPPLGDMWWAGPQRSGWGLALLQQRASFFGVLFTYRADGSPTWFVMPSGIFSEDGAYDGLVYRTRGSDWPVEYDPAALVAVPVGAFRMRFTNETLTLDFTAEGVANRVTLTRQAF